MMVSFSIKRIEGGPVATIRKGSGSGVMLPTLRKYGIAASYKKVGAALPYDAEVEYLKSTGTQWIDTGIEGKSSLSANIVFMFSTGMVGKDKYVIGAVSIGNTRCYFGTYQSKWMLGYRTYYTADGIQDNVQYDAQVSWLKGNQYVKVSGTDIITATDNVDFNTGCTLYLFTRNNNGGGFSSFAASAKIYSCKIYDNGVLVRDFIPVRFTNEQGAFEGAMYDRLGTGGMNPDGSPRTDGLYRNRGTGAFSWGNDVAVVPPPETVQCVVPGKWTLDVLSFTNRRFMGWFTAPNDPFDESGVLPAGAREIINGSAMDLPLPETVYACWQHKATVTFDANRDGAVVGPLPELYVGDGAGYAADAYIESQGEGDEAFFMGWALNVRYPASSTRMDVDPYSVPGGVYDGMPGAVSTGDVFYGLWLLPAQVVFDANLSSVPGDFSPQVDPYHPTYYDESPYNALPDVYDDGNRHDIRFAFWSKDTTPPCSYDPYDGVTTSVDPYTAALNGETLYAVWQKAVCVRLIDGVDDPVVYVFEGESLPSLPDPGRTPSGAVFDGWEDAFQMMDVHEGDPVYSSYIGNNPSYPDDWTLTPKWAYAVSVTFDASTNGGSMPPGWTPPAYYSGRPYGTLPTPVHPTLSFAGWYDGNTPVTASSIVPAGGANLVAEYAAQSYSVDLNGEWRQSGDPRTGDVDEFDEGYETQYPPDQSYDGVYESFANWHVADEMNYSNCPVARMYIDVAGYTEFTVYIRSFGESFYDFCIAMEPDVDLQGNYDPSADYWDGTHYDDPWYYIQADTSRLVPDGVDVWGDTPPFGVSDGAQSVGIKATTIGWQTGGSNGLSDYMPVTYQLDGGSHRICIIYKKDPSVDENADRGYVIIPPGGQPL